MTRVLGAERCGIDGCKDRHYRLLHKEKVAPGSKGGKADTPLTKENKSSTLIVSWTKEVIRRMLTRMW